jgi:hypothetical protein
MVSCSDRTGVNLALSQMYITVGSRNRDSRECKQDSLYKYYLSLSRMAIVTAKLQQPPIVVVYETVT